MKECCAACKKRLELVMFDYQHGGFERHNMGHACTAFETDGTIIYMVGNDPENDMCESFEPKEDRK